MGVTLKWVLSHKVGLGGITLARSCFSLGAFLKAIVLGQLSKKESNQLVCINYMWPTLPQIPKANPQVFLYLITGVELKRRADGTLEMESAIFTALQFYEVGLKDPEK